jgi:hypothetical protein
MGSRSRWSQLLKKSEELRRFSQKHGKLAFAPLAEVARRLHPVPYYWRQYESFPDALRAWAADTPPDKAEDGSRLDWIRGRIPLKKEVRRYILAALGEADFQAARRALDEWVKRAARGAGFPAVAVPRLKRNEDPRIGVSRELAYVRSLLFLYEDPARYFRELAPQQFPPEFDPSDPAFRLQETLLRWGFGALWNPKVREAFVAASEYSAVRQLFLLGFSECRAIYPERGRKPGSKDKQRRKHSVDVEESEKRVYRDVLDYERKHGGRRGLVAASIKKEAVRLTLTTAAIKKRIQRRHPR